MSTILICVYPLAGPINATRKLAKDLRARGHTVHYIGLPDCQRHLGGESFFPVFSSVFPAGTDDGGTKKNIPLRKRLRAARMLLRCTRGFVRDLAEGSFEGFDRLVEMLQPDLMVIESTTFYVSLWGLLAFRFNIPSVLLNDCLTGPENPFVPPISSSLQPTNDWLGRWRTRLAWKLVAAERWLRGLHARATGRLSPVHISRELAKGFNYALGSLSEHEKFFLRARAPEIVLMPEAFDFPRPPTPDRYYSSASVDLLRPEVPFPSERLDPDLPVLYCSLGTTEVHGPAAYQRFFSCVIKAFENFSDRYQLVVATGRFAPGDLGSQARNVTVVRCAPQLSLLKRTAVMITHGGSNSVRECVSLGVPMLLYPLDFDQFGHAARAVFHGVGLRGNFLRVNSEEVSSKLNKLLTQPYYKLQARRMMQEFLKAEETRSAARAIELFLGVGSIDKSLHSFNGLSVRAHDEKLRSR